MTEVFLTGGSGRDYIFVIHPINTFDLQPTDIQFSAEGACYIFTKENAQRSVDAIYIGKTHDLSERFDNHHKKSCIREHRATHICVYTDGMDNYLQRLTVENDLLANENPPCNG